ncbi:MAG: hypothetical protein ABSG01_16470 [Anaerolineales bacterium]|jgi:hypothetical protein
MDENFNPFDSLVKEIMGNIRFLDSLLSKAVICSGIVGMVCLAVAIVLLLK